MKVKLLCPEYLVKIPNQKVNATFSQEDDKQNFGDAKVINKQGIALRGKQRDKKKAFVKMKNTFELF